MNRLRSIPTPSARRRGCWAARCGGLAAALAPLFVLTSALYASGERASQLSASAAVISPTSTTPQVYPFTRRNVLLIELDDIGVDKIEPYVTYFNSTLRTDDNISTAGPIAPLADTTPCTPTIAALAKSGVMFVNAWGCSSCSPARACVYTGTHPFRHKVYSPRDSEDFTIYGPTTIAQVLDSAGYANGLFGKWHLGSNAGHRPLNNGWDIHKGFLGGELDGYYAWTKISSDAAGTAYTTYTNTYATSMFRGDAVSWINAQSGHWMATVAFNAAHWVGPEPGTLQNQGPPAGCGCHAVTVATNEDQVFRATVECMDAKIAELLAGINATKLENTTIILIGDNGTDDARSFHFPDGHGKGSLFEGALAVPLVVADGYAFLHGGAQSRATSGVGRVISPGRVSTALVQGLDLYATIAEIAGADGSCGVDAVSLTPLLDTTATSVRAACFAQTSDTDWAVRNEFYKLILQTDAYGTATYQLFDLSSDRWERHDLLADGWSAMEGSVVSSLLTAKAVILAIPAGCP